MSIQIFPYDIFSNPAKAKRYRVKIKPCEDADPSIVTIRTDFCLRDLVDHINRQEIEVLAIRQNGAWHELT